VGIVAAPDKRRRPRLAWEELVSLSEQDHFLDTTPLRSTLPREGWIRLDRINAHPPARHLRITVAEMETGRLRIFGNNSDPQAGAAELKYGEVPSPIMVAPRQPIPLADIIRYNPENHE
jgi:hypothetical protein